MLAGESNLTRRIADADPRSGFTCGEPLLDSFFARHALANDRYGVGTTFVMPGDALAGEPPVLGFYSLSMADMDRSRLASFLANEARARLPRYPLPVALIGRLAVHVGAKGRGLGALLLADALGRIAVASTQVGCVGVVVDGKHASAEAFYEHHGFTTLDKASAYPRRMFLPIETVREAF